MILGEAAGEGADFGAPVRLSLASVSVKRRREGPGFQ